MDNLPATPEALAALIQQQGAVFNAYANGAKSEFLKNGRPAFISPEEYAAWTSETITDEQMSEVVALDGEFPGSYLSDDEGRLALPRIELGNIVLLPQLAAGAGDDDFAIVHGTDAAPPHAIMSPPTSGPAMPSGPMRSSISERTAVWSSPPANRWL